MGFLELRGVCRSYGAGAARTEVLTNVDLEIERGEFVAVVGFSGSGKTTLVSLIAGLIEADRGSIILDGEPIRGPGPDRGVVFQNYSLLPWMTVYENVALAVDRVFREDPPAERRQRVQRYIDLVGLLPAAGKRPAELSGGMRQRVAVARALAIDPRILLLDEPLGALDALTRATLQGEIASIWAADRKTVVLITNDVDEGILLADRIIPLTPGPGATLGPSFPVPLERPRDRKNLNHDPRFRRIRNDVTNYLIEVGSHRRGGGAAADREPPRLKPIDVSEPSRRAA